jgi:diguanylate cyclase (GGDEF)-like protein/PAS domain S-box-containing protein
MLLCGMVVIAIGWLALLPGAHTATMAATVRREGPASWRPLAILGGLQTLIGSVLVATGVAPSLISAPEVYGLIAALTTLQFMSGQNMVAAARKLDHSADELRASEQRFRTLVQRSFDAITVVDRHSRITYASPVIEELLGYKPSDLVGTTRQTLVHPDDLAVATEALASAYGRPGATVCIEYRLRHQNGAYRWFEFHIRNLVDDPAIGGIVVNQRDVTERRMWERRLAHDASHDALTGLPNRAAFLEELGRACRESVTTHAAFGVLFLDLDGFKAVNDTLGHAVGDGVLCALASRLATAMPDASCIARFAGDEFTILLEGLSDPEELRVAATRIADALVVPLPVDHHRIRIGASVGTAWSDSHRDAGPEALLRTADAEMYQAKRGSDRDVVIV